MNLKTRTEQRGWSMSGVSPCEGAPRNCARWSHAEQEDLRTAFNACVSTKTIARLHGRTQEGILCRIDEMGLTDYNTAARNAVPNPQAVGIPINREWEASWDYHTAARLARHPADPILHQKPREPVALNCRCVVAPVSTSSTKKVSTMKLTANKLMLLLAFYRGTERHEYVNGTRGADLCWLQVNGMVEPNDLGEMVITDAGRQLVDHILDKGSLSGKVSTTYDNERNTSVLDNTTFYAVANGDCTKGGGGADHAQAVLKSPPKVVQPTQAQAEREAIRLAKLHQGQKFFVLKAVSVHHTTTPVESTRL